MAASPTVKPEGLALAHLCVTIVFGFLATFIIALRIWVRASHNVFGTDDTLMLIGYILYGCLVGVSSRGTFVGLGTRDEKLAQVSPEIFSSGLLYTWLFQMFYCLTLIFVKGSICTTLLRIATARSHRIISWLTLAVSSMSAFIVIIGLFTMCRPLHATWNRSEGECAPPIVLTSLAYQISASSMVTDLVCAILPGFMLWKTQIKIATKISITIILGLGVFASVATIVRFPYIAYYYQKEDYLYHTCNIAMWSMVEMGIGIIAGSLPALRRLLKNWVDFGTSHAQSSGRATPYAGSHSRAVTSTIGTASRTQRFQRSRITPSSSRGCEEGNWERLDDDSSKRRIYVTVDMEMQSMDHATVGSVGSHESVQGLAKQI
ncbi:hypothetical protein NM208_g9472 [Fusarium decemcellulare]|uniref:Uncharacterized protein n=1 Tax=Fusarium decemcellulare TaxID=57161 RepID=A0ACC1S1F8_9HYPO|nr:hypothetical protein NM208_g9472 [Fusarium decemcellulare]